MQEQPAARERFVIEWTAGTVLRDMTIHQPHAGAAHFRIGISQVGFALAQSFYFGADQSHARLHFFEQVVVVRGGAILGNNLLAGCIFFASFFAGFGHQRYLSERWQLGQGALLGLLSDVNMRTQLWPGRCEKYLVSARAMTEQKWPELSPPE